MLTPAAELYLTGTWCRAGEDLATLLCSTPHGVDPFLKGAQCIYLRHFLRKGGISL